MSKAKKTTVQINFKPGPVVKRLLSALPDRAQDILTKRYGLLAPDRMTLEAIGGQYGITRERVRQVENYAIAQIVKSSAYQKESVAFSEIEKLITNMGGIVHEADLLEAISSDEVVQNHVHFLLVVGQAFKKKKEDEEFMPRWYVDEELAEKVHQSLRKLYQGLPDTALINESDLVSKFLENLKDVNEVYRNDEIINRWLKLSKNINKNPLGEWGKSDAPGVNLKGMRDYAFLVIRKHGEPMHFTEVAKRIGEVFGKRAHVATCHNELIRDSRFVLVGRGLYALTDWGYQTGVVKDVISSVIKKHGPMTRSDIISKVMEQRKVKENTIIVNLHNSKFFKRDKDGKYHIADQKQKVSVK